MCTIIKPFRRVSFLCLMLVTYLSCGENGSSAVMLLSRNPAVSWRSASLRDLQRLLYNTNSGGGC